MLKKIQETKSREHLVEESLNEHMVIKLKFYTS